MNFKDLDKLSHIEKTFELNFKITRLYRTYLELFPTLITKEMIQTLTEDGAISAAEAFRAILCEAFGIDVDASADDRRLIRSYLTRSVRRLEPERYTNNPYYKNIKIPTVKEGNWEFKNECYPAYRGVICNDMIIDEDFTEVPPLGFFEEDFYFPAVLEGGNEWMTLTPVDLDTSDDAIAAARGKVVTFGLGLGYFAYMASEKQEVESVTVVELSEKVTELFKKHILPQFPHKDKIKIVNSDAFLYSERVMPRENFDFAFVDTWRDASAGAPMYKKMKALEHLSPTTEFSYWIESFLVSRIRAEKFVEEREKILTGEKDAPRDFDELISRIKSTD